MKGVADGLKNNTVTCTNMSEILISLFFYICMALTKLCNGHNEIESEGAACLAAVLKENTVIIFLYLSYDYLLLVIFTDIDNFGTKT
jgi:hypothetical protein